MSVQLRNLLPNEPIPARVAIGDRGRFVYRVTKVSRKMITIFYADFGPNDPGPKCRHRPMQFRWDGCGFKRSGLYLKVPAESNP